MGRTVQLIAMMVRDTECGEYIRNGWNALYNDILNTHFSEWNKFDELAGYAILDWLEYKGII